VKNLSLLFCPEHNGSVYLINLLVINDDVIQIQIDLSEIKTKVILGFLFLLLKFRRRNSNFFIMCAFGVFLV
jgi:hypothetical protein